MSSIPRLLTTALTVAAGLLGCALGAQPASAQSRSCQIASFASPTFGEVNVLPGTAVNASGSVSVRCSGGGLLENAVVCVQISPGVHTGVAPNRVLVADSGSNLSFNFFDGTAIWGRTVPTAFGSGAVQLNVALTNGAGTSASKTIRATIAANQTAVPPGVYTNSFDLSYYYLFYIGLFAPDCGTMSGYTGPVTDRTFVTSATVSKRCEVTATNMDFGSLGLLNRAINADSAVSVKCSNGVAYAVGLGSGNNGTNASQRKLKNQSTGETIQYQLYQDGARSLIWGSAEQAKQGTGTASTQQLTVYGQIPAQSSTPTPGLYNDTVVVTVTY